MRRSMTSKDKKVEPFYRKRMITHLQETIMAHRKIRREQKAYLKAFVDDEKMNEHLVPDKVLRSRAVFESLDKEGVF